jgi:hypothetical protein
MSDAPCARLWRRAGRWELGLTHLLRCRCDTQLGASRDDRDRSKASAISRHRRTSASAESLAAILQAFDDDGYRSLRRCGRLGDARRGHSGTPQDQEPARGSRALSCRADRLQEPCKHVGQRRLRCRARCESGPGAGDVLVAAGKQDCHGSFDPIGARPLIGRQTATSLLRRSRQHGYRSASRGAAPRAAPRSDSQRVSGCDGLRTEASPVR